MENDEEEQLEEQVNDVFVTAVKITNYTVIKEYWVNCLHRANTSAFAPHASRRFMKKNYFGDFADCQGTINYKAHCSYDSNYMFDHCVGDPPRSPFLCSSQVNYTVVAFHTSMRRILEATRLSSTVACEGSTLPSQESARVSIKSSNSNKCQRENAVAKCILELSIMQARQLRHPIPDLRI